MAMGVVQIERVFMVHGGVICPLQRGILKVRRVKKSEKNTQSVDASGQAKKGSKQKNR